MNSRLHCSGEYFGNRLRPDWQPQLHSWRAMLTECARNPSRKHVRVLRTLTLRLRVALEHCLVGQSPDSAATHAFRRWKKDGKKLRRALQPVRDIDVGLAKLDVLRGTLSKSTIAESQLGRHNLTEIEKLESHLKQRRQAGIDHLTTTIDARSKRLRRLSKEIESEMALESLPHVCPSKQVALQVFERLAIEFPHLNGSNLHSYRKRMKQALYLAEIAAAVDHSAGDLVAEFRRIHDISGKWHDWEALTVVARQISPVNSKHEPFITLLEGNTAAALQEALAISRSFRERTLVNAS